MMMLTMLIAVLPICLKQLLPATTLCSHPAKVDKFSNINYASNRACVILDILTSDRNNNEQKIRTG